MPERVCEDCGAEVSDHSGTATSRSFPTECPQCGGALAPADLTDVDEDDDDGSASALAVLPDGGRERGRSDNSMERFTIRVPEQQEDGLDQLVEMGLFPNRSEAARAAIRQFLSEHDVVEQRRPLRTDGGERIDPSGGRATHPRAGRFEAAEVSREARDAARERQARREAASQQRGGVGDQDSSRCHRCRGDELPCWDCLRAQGGDR